jgi:hypothetical protein
MKHMSLSNPIIWIIGATRSSKSYLAKGLSFEGRAGLNLPAISTSNFFRGGYGREDTVSRDYVFGLSEFSAVSLAKDPQCCERHLIDEIEGFNSACIVEGERNPVQFSNLYDPQKDMVFFLERKDMEPYDTTIEGGIGIIEDIVRWNVRNGITPQNTAFKMVFGDENLRVSNFGKSHEADILVAEDCVGPRTEGARYPWIGPMIERAHSLLLHHYGVELECDPATILGARL